MLYMWMLAVSVWCLASLTSVNILHKIPNGRCYEWWLRTKIKSKSCLKVHDWLNTRCRLISANWNSMQKATGTISHCGFTATSIECFDQFQSSMPICCMWSHVSKIMSQSCFRISAVMVKSIWDPSLVTKPWMKQQESLWMYLLWIPRHSSLGVRLVNAQAGVAQKSFDPVCGLVYDQIPLAEENLPLAQDHYLIFSHCYVLWGILSKYSLCSEKFSESSHWMTVLRVFCQK